VRPTEGQGSFAIGRAFEFNGPATPTFYVNGHQQYPMGDGAFQCNASITVFFSRKVGS
jgi:hypothetical protein